ncbi:methionine biosynthesis protein MetW [Kordiimonas sp. SCSIO 12603]|uniref:methionine biosynthesis protein MetW n=1 Tax=Kordiimonas sp. SCSIO 12603 TaxID=2829596 RepID=UPI0021045BCC|nr:methionine biosynthesis protein MetW [Kordiimonas sp. SCSIO 12603]UTW58499.1 methionine biosynthesis protein MetW [Kordiimonas sp. SCSIO 12603]
MTALRKDLQLIADMIEPESRVLDVGCDDGALLDYLVNEKDIDGRGIEISQKGVNSCVAKGLFVVQGDADNDLHEYPDNTFDYVILSKALQAMHKPREVMLNLLRIGKRAIVTIPNFGQWRVRFSLLTRGRMPVTKALDKTWYNTSNIHFCTITDLFDLIEQENLKVAEFVPHMSDGTRLNMGRKRANWHADQALFLLEK